MRPATAHTGEPRLPCIPGQFIYQLSIVLLILLAGAAASAQDEPPLRLVQTIPMPDIDGRIDHFSIDLKGQRAFLAALAKNTIEVVDLKAGQVTQTLPGYAKPQGVRYVAELNRLFVTTGLDGALWTLDGQSLSVVDTAHVSVGADAIGYDPGSKQLYVGSGGSDAHKESGDLTVFDAVTGAKVDTIVTDAHAGGSVVDKDGRNLYVLVPEKSQVVVLERKTHAKVVTWTIPGIQKDVAIDLDGKTHRLFLGVRSPPSVVVLDASSGNVVASVETVATLDGLAFDPSTKRIYTSGGEGFVDVTQQKDADHYERVARIPTGPNARTSLFVPEWRRLYVAVPRDGDRNAELLVFEAVR